MQESGALHDFVLASCVICDIAPPVLPRRHGRRYIVQRRAPIAENRRLPQVPENHDERTPRCCKGLASVVRAPFCWSARRRGAAERGAAA